MRQSGERSTDIPTHSGRSEVFVLGLVEHLELHAGIGRIHLQVKGRGLHGLLLVTGQFGKAVGKGVSNAEFNSPCASLWFLRFKLSLHFADP